MPAGGHALRRPKLASGFDALRAFPYRVPVQGPNARQALGARPGGRVDQPRASGFVLPRLQPAGRGWLAHLCRARVGSRHAAARAASRRVQEGTPPAVRGGPPPCTRAGTRRTPSAAKALGRRTTSMGAARHRHTTRSGTRGARPGRRWPPPETGCPGARSALARGRSRPTAKRAPPGRSRRRRPAARPRPPRPRRRPRASGGRRSRRWCRCGRPSIAPLGPLPPGTSTVDPSERPGRVLRRSRTALAAVRAAIAGPRGRLVRSQVQRFPRTEQPARGADGLGRDAKRHRRPAHARHPQRHPVCGCGRWRDRPAPRPRRSGAKPVSSVGGARTRRRVGKGGG